MSDPNFPRDLNIHPLDFNSGSNIEYRQQELAIARYGIAGRVWEAGQPLVEYFTPGLHFDPPCSIFQTGPHRILELGSGQALPSLHLASFLSSDDLLILTDLPNVIALCQQSIHQNEGKGKAQIIAESLAWGDDISHVQRYSPFTHVIMCDLIYFPHLYPRLMHTILRLSEPTGVPVIDETFGPEIILSYQSRTLVLEESFFDTLSLYFKLTPVTGKDWEAKIFICKRWRVSEEWRLPGLCEVMKGGKGIIRGKDFGLIDSLFGSLEWEG